MSMGLSPLELFALRHDTEAESFDRLDVFRGEGFLFEEVRKSACPLAERKDRLPPEIRHAADVEHPVFHDSPPSSSFARLIA